jgi:hypothetical protein
MNKRTQEWRGRSARDLGRLQARTHLISPWRAKIGLNETYQIDFLEQIQTPDLSLHILHFSECGPCLLLRNIGTLSGLVKGRRCWAVEAENPASITNESDESLLSVLGIAVNSPQEAFHA